MVEVGKSVTQKVGLKAPVIGADNKVTFRLWARFSGWWLHTWRHVRETLDAVREDKGR